MRDIVDFTCPNCKKRHEVSLAQVQKHVKSGKPIMFNSGCSFPPDKMLDVLADDVWERLGGDKPKLSE